jgi:hypothetical protein
MTPGNMRENGVGSLAVLWLSAWTAGFRCYHAPRTLPTVQPRNPVQASEAANPVMMKSRDQIGFDTTATEASIGPCMILDRTVASASGNVVLTISAFELSVPVLS